MKTYLDDNLFVYFLDVSQGDCMLIVNENNKSMVVKVTDERLLEKTGGIIQGMSGSPVIQNGKLIGALTHVL